MFYKQSEGHGLRFDPFKAIVSPRPIGWISTVDSKGVANIAPYSFFNALGARPHLVGFSSDGMKHSIANAVETGEFVHNIVSGDLLEAMNKTALVVDKDVNEFDLAGIEMAPSRIVRAPRAARSPASLECKVVNFMELGSLSGKKSNIFLVVGEVVGVHIDDAFIVDGRFDLGCVMPAARCGYMDYAVVSEIFELEPPEVTAMQVL